MAEVDDQMPTPKPADCIDVMTIDVGDAMLPHAAIDSTAAQNAPERTLKRIVETLARAPQLFIARGFAFHCPSCPFCLFASLPLFYNHCPWLS